VIFHFLVISKLNIYETLNAYVLVYMTLRCEGRHKSKQYLKNVANNFLKIYQLDLKERFQFPYPFISEFLLIR